MAFDGLLITEIFFSLQGETSLSGIPFTFIRMTGCNLRCNYCDSAYSFKGGQRMSLNEVLEKVSSFPAHHVLLTGGEPLLQRGTLPLLEKLLQKNYRVSIETHGEAPIQSVAGKARIVMDIKTPGSGMCRRGFESNLPHLRPGDEVKFVITSSEDYLWAADFVRSHPLKSVEYLFSPAVPAAGSPGTFPGVQAKDLADWILRDRLPVRFQIQLHKYLWGADTKGV
jgi:7-carboxy-7-deazaguanine synthase